MKGPFTIEGKSKSSNKTVRFPDELIERLERVSQSKNISFSAVVIQCCEYALANLQEEVNEGN